MFETSTPINVFLTWGDAGYADELFWAAARTVEISLLGYLGGLILGFLGALGKLSRYWSLRRLLDLYTTLFRALPELVLIMLLYYVGTGAVNRVLVLLGFGTVDVNGMAVAILVLGSVQGAYATEVLRAAILAVPAGQVEAAKAAGMPKWLRLRRIVVPAMLPNAIPGLANLWLGIMKDTALISIIGFSELALVTQQVAGATKRYFLVYALALAVYWAMSQCSVTGFAWAERRLQRGVRLPQGLR